jgi:hypothetical protein
MNTFLTRFASSAAKQSHLRARLEELFDRHVGQEFTFEDLCEKFPGVDYQTLGIGLGELVRAGRLKMLFRVYSQKVSGGGIQDFDSLEKIPNQIFDWRGGVNMEVTGEDTRVIYKVLR